MKKRISPLVVIIPVIFAVIGGFISSYIYFVPNTFAVSGEWVDFHGRINRAEYRIEYCSGEACIGNGGTLLSVVTKTREIRQYEMDGYRLDWDWTAGREHGPIYAVIDGGLVQVGSRYRGKVTWDETCIADSSEACFLEGEQLIIMERKVFHYHEIRQEVIVEVEGPFESAEIYAKNEEGTYTSIGTSTLVNGQEELYWYHENP